MSCEEQAMVHTDHCTLFKCQDWDRETGGITYPLLVKDENGFWVCPDCGSSYGRDALQDKKG